MGFLASLNPFRKKAPSAEERVKMLQQVANKAMLQMLQMRAKGQGFQARYDAADDSAEAFINHWGNADHLSPNAANEFGVRRKLRSRSRFEVSENNPYLKGMSLTIANDFVGSGPKLKITDKRLSKDRKQHIERLYRRWAKKTHYRRKLWQMRLAKMVDGEGIKTLTLSGRPGMKIRQSWRIIEADQMTTEHMFSALALTRGNRNTPQGLVEIDGIRLGPDREAVEYHILDEHPGESLFFNGPRGQWFPSDMVSHWFRRDRPWNRGIPETTASLPLCALLRRYTLATVKAAETAADFAAVLESVLPPSAAMWTSGPGTDPLDPADAFETIPIEQGMMTVLPWGYKLGQMDARHPSQMYNVFVDTILREISRPLLMPFNMSSGSSKDSNMASGVVDIHMYRASQDQERRDCQDEVLDEDFELFWREAVLTGEAFEPIPGDNGSVIIDNPDLLTDAPEHEWGWDQVAIEHTDPDKIMRALETAKKNRFITDRDIQEGRFNRSYEDWQDEVREEEKFRQEIEPQPVAPDGSDIDDEDPEDFED